MVERMRIAHVTATFPPYLGGTGNVCYHNAVGLARLGHEVTVITSGMPRIDGHQDAPEISVQRLPVVLRFGNAPLSPGLLGLSGYDIVHLHYPFYFGAEMLFLNSFVRGSRYVVTYHNDVLFRGAYGLAVHLHHLLLGRLILARAHRVLVTSLDYAQASRLGEFLRRKPGSIGEMPNGVDSDRFHPGICSEGLRARYGLDRSRRIALFVGALDKPHFFKGVDVLLRAAAQLSDTGVKLLVVGDGNLRAQYQRQASELGIGNRVVFCGRVSDEELPSHYALCDLLILPSVTMGEAFGLVLVEAMACGKPVIASNLPGVRTVVTDGEDGLLIQPGNVDDLAAKMRSLLRNPERRQEMGQMGRAKIETKYDWKGIALRLEKIYERALID